MKEPAGSKFKVGKSVFKLVQSYLRVFYDDFGPGGDIDEPEFAMITRNNVLMQVFDARPRCFADVEADVEAERVVNRFEAVHGCTEKLVHLFVFFVAELPGVIDVSQRKKQQMPGVVWIQVDAGCHRLVFPDGEVLYTRFIAYDRADDAVYRRAAEAGNVFTLVWYK